MKQLLTASQRKLVDYNPTINLFSLIQILQTELLPKVSYVQRESQIYFLPLDLLKNSFERKQR